MKRITKQETLPALAVPEVLSVPELAYPARLGKRAVVQVLRKADVSRAGRRQDAGALTPIGAANNGSSISALSPRAEEKLAICERQARQSGAQNEALRAELARLKQEK